MDVNEYIASGVLELYALGTLSATEMKEVEEMASKHPEVAAELKSVQDAMNSYANAHARNPRPSLRPEILKRVTGSDPEARIVPIYSPHELTYKYLIAACLASLIISTFASVFFYQRWSDAEDRYVAMLNEKNVIAQNFNLVKFNYEKTAGDLAVMRDPAMTIYTLNPTDSSKYYKAHVYWNKYTKETFIDVADLPPTSADTQYQLWALAGGQPVDAGIFNMEANGGIQKVKQVQTADAWAVTLEPKGGSAVPTLDKMYLASVN